MAHNRNLRIYTADGKETEFPGDSKWHWNRDALKLDLQSSHGDAGWHQDRFAYLVHEIETLTIPPEIEGCIVQLRLSEGRPQKLEFKGLYSIRMNIGYNLLHILGQDVNALINIDYLQFYQILHTADGENNNKNEKGFVMTKEQDRKATIVDIFGERQDFNSLKEFHLNTTQSILIINFEAGIFHQHLDKMRYCIVDMENQNVEYRYDACHLILTDGRSDRPEKMTIERVIKIDWNANTGLLGIYGQAMTAIFHLDYVVSYHLTPKSG